jgi:hypothetical protein
MEQIPNSESTEVLDSRWYKRFEDLVFDDYAKLADSKENREIEREAFLSGVVDNPTLDYPKLEDFDFAEREAVLLSLKEDILQLEQNPIVKKIYRTKINEALASVRMLKATKEGDDRRFSKYGDFLYGKPTEENSAYITSTLIDRFATKKNGSEEKKRGRAALLEFLSALPQSATAESFDKTLFPKGIEIKGTVESAEEAEAVFAEALKEFGIDDWQVVVDTTNGLTGFSASQENKEVNIPSTEVLVERKLSKQKLMGLVEHEIKTHALRRFNGERSKLQLLGLGLDRHIKGEEGVATYAEQQVTGTDEFAGIPKYLAIAVAKGLGGQPRDFRETHAIMQNYYLAALKDGEDLTTRAEKAAWNDCVRIFRGSTCKTPGAVYGKDLAYFSGNKDVWHLVSKDNDVVNSFSIGKFDPTNTEHVYLLTQLGILDSDLESLEQSV